MGPACTGTTWPELQVTTGPVFGDAKAATRLPPQPCLFASLVQPPLQPLGHAQVQGGFGGMQTLQAPKVAACLSPTPNRWESPCL